MNRLTIPAATKPRILVVSRRVVRNLVVPGVLMTTAAAPAYAAPPPDASGVFSDWFRNLTVPGIPGAPCCTLADCRMVDAKWNDRTQHYEARVMREKFSNSLGRPILSQEDEDAQQAAKSAWMKRWFSRYGDKADVWIEISDAKVNAVQNPTGHAVLCWSVFNAEFNGVYCFVPYTAAFNERFEPMNAVV